jgi:hypothetical protein
MPLLYTEDVVDDGLPTWTSPRRCGGRVLLLKYCMLFMLANSVLGDIERVRCAGDGVERGDSWFDACSLSDRDFVLAAAAAAAALAPSAKASARARAESSTVPTWWFWCLVRVVRRVKVFWQSA